MREEVEIVNISMFLFLFCRLIITSVAGSVSLSWIALISSDFCMNKAFKKTRSHVLPPSLLFLMSHDEATNDEYDNDAGLSCVFPQLMLGLDSILCSSYYYMDRDQELA